MLKNLTEYKGLTDPFPRFPFGKDSNERALYSPFSSSHILFFWKCCWKWDWGTRLDISRRGEERPCEIAFTETGLGENGDTYVGWVGWGEGVGVEVADYWEFSMQLKERGQGESEDVTSNHVWRISNNLSPIVGNIYERCPHKLPPVSDFRKYENVTLIECFAAAHGWVKSDKFVAQMLEKANAGFPTGGRQMLEKAPNAGFSTRPSVTNKPLHPLTHIF